MKQRNQPPALPARTTERNGKTGCAATVSPNQKRPAGQNQAATLAVDEGKMQEPSTKRLKRNNGSPLQISSDAPGNNSTDNAADLGPSAADILQNIKATTSDDGANAANDGGLGVAAKQVAAGLAKEPDESPHILYDYANFDPSKLKLSRKIYDAKDSSGGQMAYLLYTYPDGHEGRFMVNTPCFRSAKGCQLFKDSKTGKESIILYGTADYTEESESFKKFIQIFDMRCAGLIIERKWHGNNSSITAEELYAKYLLPSMSQETTKDGVTYAPSIKLQVVTEARNRTAFFEEPALGRVPGDKLQANKYFTAIVYFRWIFRKKQGDLRAYPLGYSFSQNVAAKQVVIHADSDDNDDVCNVRLPTKIFANQVPTDQVADDNGQQYAAGTVDQGFAHPLGALQGEGDVDANAAAAAAGGDVPADDVPVPPALPVPRNKIVLSASPPMDDNPGE